MAEAKTTKVVLNDSNSKIFDLAEILFTKDNETEGVWVEPVIFGRKIGLSLKIIGANSDKMSIIQEDFNKRRSELSDIKDPDEKARKIDELFIDNAIKRVVDMKFSENSKVLVNGKTVTLTEEFKRTLFEKSPQLTSFVIRYGSDPENFLTKKND